MVKMLYLLRILVVNYNLVPMTEFSKAGDPASTFAVKTA